MADIRPFHGLRFDPARVQLGAVLCPPFDVMTPAEQEAYHARDLHNIVRVELGTGPADSRAPSNRYDAAAAVLRAWQAERVLVHEDEPALYLHEQQFQLGNRTLTRRGLFVAGRLHDWDEGAVLPHEHTRAGPKQDRLALLEATQTNVSPLWLLYDGADGHVAEALDAAWRAEPLARAKTNGELHTLGRITDRETLRRVVAGFQERPLYIADGHHRYETAQIYRNARRQRDHGAGPEAGYEFALMMLVALDDPGMVTLATHRLVRGLGQPLETVRAALAEHMTLTPLTLPAGDDAAVGAAWEGALAEAGKEGHAFGLYERSGAWILRPRADGAWRALLPEEHSAAWKGLDVAVLDELAIRRACGIHAEGESAHADATSHAPSDRLAYVSDFPNAVAAVRAGQADQAYLLNPTRVEQVCAVAAARDRMPPKSTYFYPKPPTGLVMHPLDGTRPAP